MKERVQDFELLFKGRSPDKEINFLRSFCFVLTVGQQKLDNLQLLLPGN